MAVPSSIHHSRHGCFQSLKSFSRTTSLFWWAVTVAATTFMGSATMAFGFEMPCTNTRGQSAYSRSINSNIHHSKPPAVRLSFLSLTTGNAGDNIDFQSDAENFGRGDYHLSAALSENDVVVYQTGTWCVDGVPVGDDSLPPSFEYAAVDNLQIVWSHNCEHGVIRAWKMKLINVEQTQQLEDDDQQLADNRQRLVRTDEAVDFGPEQLVARIPVMWLGNENDDQQDNMAENNADTCVATISQELKDDLWRNPPSS